MQADHSDAWTLTQLMSPRRTVRVAVADAGGAIQNLYPAHRRVDHSMPDMPWAVNLATDAGFFFLAFDLDATHSSEAEVEADCEQLAEWLTARGIHHVVCKSGPTEGRHLWVGLSEPLAAHTVATLAKSLKRRLKSLDVSPLMNSATGCVRPPGAPHRNGGRSEILSGNLRSLTSPVTLPATIERWTTDLAAEDTTRELTAPVSVLTGHDDHQTGQESHQVGHDNAGNPRIFGKKRPLPQVSQHALTAQPDIDSDASATLMRVLVGAAAARWSLADVETLTATAPGLEHLRTRRDGQQRRPRPLRGSASADAVLRRQWTRAVQFVATATHARGLDPEFTKRSDAVTLLVHQAQLRADAMPGRWQTGAGPTMRRVLDALSILLLQAVDGIVEADQRRLAIMCGIGTQTARRGLARLAAEGWIRLVDEADGMHARRWQLVPRDGFHSTPDEGGPQGTPHPWGHTRELTPSRLELLQELTSRLELAAHDVFTPGGLGHHAGNVFARIHERSASVALPQVRTALGQLDRFGLIMIDGNRLRRVLGDGRKFVAEVLGVDGICAGRAQRIRVERELWAWWNAELTWMCAPRPKQRPSPYTNLFVLGNEYVHGAHPRKGRGRADFRRARRALQNAHWLARPL